MNTQISEDQIREVFKAIDLDGNGRITFDEFCHLAQKRPLKLDQRFNQTQEELHSTYSFRSRSMNRNKFSSSPGGDHVKPAGDILSARDDAVSTLSKARYDVSSLYDQVELAQPSTRVKRKLKIINPAVSNNIT